MSNLPTSKEDLTRLLLSAQDDPESLDTLYRLVHGELRAMATSALRGVPASLQPTELVSELFLKFHGKDIPFENRQHFFGSAARALRQILADHGRAKIADKRGGPNRDVTLDDNVPELESSDTFLMDLSAAIEDLAVASDRAARLTELRYFCGLSLEDCAGMMGVSLTTANRDWRFARAFLADYLIEFSLPE